MRRFTKSGTLLMVVLWAALVVLTSPYALRLGEAVQAGQAGRLPAGAESAGVAALLNPSGSSESLPLAVLWTAGEPEAGITSFQQVEAHRILTEVTDSRSGTEPSLAQDGEAMIAVIPIGPDNLSARLDHIRDASDAVPGTEVHLAGPAAAQLDLNNAFAHTDGMLLAAALGGVLVILLLVYRSPLLSVLVMITALLTLAVACALLYLTARTGWLEIDRQSQGIVLVLVIGATIDYALLLTARYQEELEHRADLVQAMTSARKATTPPVLASAATVACAMMVLTASSLPSSRSPGPVVAVAMICCAAASLTFLPAALLLVGRSVFWPRSATTAPKTALWSRLARVTERRPRRTWLAGLLLLSAGAALAPLLSQQGVPLRRALPVAAPSVTGQSILEQHFPAGVASPLVIIAPCARAEDVRAVATASPGIAYTVIIPPAGTPPTAKCEHTQILATLADGPDSRQAQDTVEGLRTTLDGTGALVGGQAAQLLDLHRTAVADQWLIMPLVLLVVLAVLVVLLRCLLLPLLLVIAAWISLLAAFGTAAAVFRLTAGAAATEPAVVLFSFVFLIALGVDYNIFLVHRVRHEALEAGTRAGVRKGLLTTGRVISAAGLVLAATFGALTAMPLLYLAQIGSIVAVGVLIDTLLVRLFLVPALILDLGDRVWWPGLLSRGRTPQPAPPGHGHEAVSHSASDPASKP
ncbi:MMPL family transporter [Streptomyces sp. NPDC012825]|uniref:MMPL family transporter n=1 Tax=Streptomyces sp. NPDC012825 TaxID=3364851 RepID=UPI0036758740